MILGQLAATPVKAYVASEIWQLARGGSGIKRCLTAPACLKVSATD